MIDNTITGIIQIILITFLPFLELRASIPYGILAVNMHWAGVFIIAVTTNILLGVVLYPLMDKIIWILTRIRFIGKIWDSYVLRTQKRIHNSIERYGEWAIAVFIGIPLPGSGVYSGAVAAYFLGLDYKKFLIANILGVIIAGTIVTLVMVTGSGALSFLVKTI